MAYDSSNIFARIICGEIPCSKVYEDEEVIAFNDIAPAAPTHILVLPKGPYTSFHDFTTQAPAPLVARFFGTVQAIAAELGIDKTGYRLITNHGPDASQSVPHFHVHILAGKQMGEIL